ncbi:hypothetical protein PFISCL1PPCAC_7495, partial [Pristionchus fissidentatus]
HSYAVKRVHIKANDMTLEKARREATALADFDHPGIVRYFAAWLESPPAGWQISADIEMNRQLHGNQRTEMRYYE